MRTISLKIAEPVLERIDNHLEMHNFSTRTEFIREAIRDKIQQLESNKFEQEMREFLQAQQSSHDDELAKEIKHDVFVELEKRFGQHYGN